MKMKKLVAMFMATGMLAGMTLSVPAYATNATISNEQSDILIKDGDDDPLLAKGIYTVYGLDKKITYYIADIGTSLTDLNVILPGTPPEGWTQSYTADSYGAYSFYDKDDNTRTIDVFVYDKTSTISVQVDKNLQITGQDIRCADKNTSDHFNLGNCSFDQSTDDTNNNHYTLYIDGTLYTITVTEPETTTTPEPTTTTTSATKQTTTTTTSTTKATTTAAKKEDPTNPTTHTGAKGTTTNPNNATPQESTQGRSTTPNPTTETPTNSSKTTTSGNNNSNNTKKTTTTAKKQEVNNSYTTVAAENAKGAVLREGKPSGNTGDRGIGREAGIAVISAIAATISGVMIWRKKK